jgi:hypothetical protein
MNSTLRLKSDEEVAQWKAVAQMDGPSARSGEDGKVSMLPDEQQDRDLNQMSIASLLQQLDAANQRILDYESEIGAVCPEDFSLKETIGSFKRELSILQMGREALLRRAEAAEAKLADARTGIENIATHARLCLDHVGIPDHQKAWVCNEISNEERIALAQIDAPAAGRPSREDRVAKWVTTRIGEAHMQSRERTMRGLEEAIEWAQAEGITENQVSQQVAYVFSRPPGTPRQEAAGVAVCLLAWCAANNATFDALADEEIERIEEKPVDQIRGSVSRKDDNDLVVVVEHRQEVMDVVPNTKGRDWVRERFVSGSESEQPTAPSDTERLDTLDLALPSDMSWYLARFNDAARYPALVRKSAVQPYFNPKYQTIREAIDAMQATAELQP